MARKSAGSRLTALARELAPAVMPYYVAGPMPRHRIPGWYWRPAGSRDPIYLGFNHLDAHAQLLGAVETAQRDQEAQAA